MRSPPILVALLLVAGSVRAATFTNSASADAFVRAAAATLNYGGAGALSVSGTGATNGSGVSNGVFDSFIRFNTAAMVTNFNARFGTNNWGISGVALRVTELGTPANALFNRGRGAFEIRWVTNDNWSEGVGTPNAPTTTTNDITYDAEGKLLNGAMDAILGRYTNGGVDATVGFSLALAPPLVEDLRAGGEVGLYLTALDPGVGFTFDSRSFGTVSARPFLEVSAAPRPGITAIGLAGADVVLSSTNGAAGGTYYALTTTNAALPVSQWTPVATNLLSGSGSFVITLTNAAIAPALGPRFFTLRTE